MEFGDRLKIARTEKGLSQEKLGEGLGVSETDVTKQTVYGWEHNNHSPTARQLALICEKLGHSADWFLFGKEMQDLKSLNGLEAQLVFLYRGLDEKAKDELLQRANEWHTLANPGRSSSNPFPSIEPPSKQDRPLQTPSDYEKRNKRTPPGQKRGAK